MALLWRGRPVGWLRPLAGRSSVGGCLQGARVEVECGSGWAESRPQVWGDLRVRGRVAGALAGSERDSTQKLAGLEEVDSREVAAIVNAAEAAADRWETSWTAFHSPPVVHTALSVLSGRADMGAVAWGGYPRAERCCLLLGREEMLPDLVPAAGMAAEVDDSGDGGGRVPEALLEGVEALQVSGNFMFDPANHRDFLGAVLGTGIDRMFVGDVLVLGERGAQVLVRPSIVEHLQQSLTMVRTVPVETRRIDLQELQVMEPKVDIIKTTEASLRLDAVASSGFRMSRNKMVERVKAGDVRVNWSSKGVKGSMLVQKGDIISCAGKGRVEVTDVGLTKKGRQTLVLTRYR